MNGIIMSMKILVELGMMRIWRVSFRRIGFGLFYIVMECYINLGVFYYYFLMEMMWGDFLIQVYWEVGGGVGGEDGWLFFEQI